MDTQLGIHKKVREGIRELQREVDNKRLESRTLLPTFDSTTFDLQSYVLVEYPKTMGEDRPK